MRIIDRGKRVDGIVLHLQRQQVMLEVRVELKDAVHGSLLRRVVSGKQGIGRLDSLG